MLSYMPTELPRNPRKLQVYTCTPRRNARLVPEAGVEPARINSEGFSYHYDFRRRLFSFVVWTFSSP